MQKPAVAAPAVAGTSMVDRCSSGISFQGSCQLTGDATDNPAGWTLGLIQVKWIDTDWAYYRGQNASDGSLLLQIGHSVASKSCRDTLTPGAVFIDNNPGVDRTVAVAGSAFPIPMSAAFGDSPSRSYDLTRSNVTAGNKINFLRESQTEIHFCTVLTLRSPTGLFQHLKHVYWNVHWQGRYQPTNFANLAAAWTITPTGAKLGNTANVSHVMDGGPGEPKFAKTLSDPGAANCNATIRAAFASPKVRESAVWTTFDVAR